MIVSPERGHERASGGALCGRYDYTLFQRGKVDKKSLCNNDVLSYP